jgi:hypothetical protein
MTRGGVQNALKIDDVICGRTHWLPLKLIETTYQFKHGVREDWKPVM